VLLPFDVEALFSDQADGVAADSNERYLSGFDATKFFYAGPAGYDAAFSIRTSEVPALSEIKFAEPIEVLISGSALLYELDTPIATEDLPVSSLEAEFPGIRRTILEHHLRYTFVRYGAPYSVSIACFDTNTPREKLPTCRMADQVAQRFLRALHVVGGTPHSVGTAEPTPIERPERVSQSFGYYGPGQIQSGTGFRGRGGRVDYTVYSQIRFPLADAPIYANSEVFKNRDRTRISSADDLPNVSYSWRDNFCERRGFPVGQCPAGMGHQGQDMRPAHCRPAPGTDRCEQYGDVVAARGGMILRSPKREAAYLFVNSANEHIRFRYLHMSPRKMDADNLLNGRRVHEGEVIGEVSNYSMKEAGTSYHLHFDVQVPTRNGWVFVNPYMTLVAAYEWLIEARGTELGDPAVVASTDPTITGSIAAPERAEPEKPARRVGRTGRHKSKWHRRRHYARD
jgi:murein DD-endopeptidase MepM/ murein hydrolase activator NlpD